MATTTQGEKQMEKYDAAKTTTVSFRPSDLARLDALRGRLSRSAYLQILLVETAEKAAAKKEV